MKKIDLLLKHLLAVLFLSCSYLNATSQSMGKISGTVTDKRNGDPLIGVTILLDGSSIGSITDIQGAYLLNEVPVGKHSVTIKYIGYTTRSISDINVLAGDVTPLNVVMDEASSQKLTEVVIRSSYKQESVNALYSIQKNNSVISDGISADLIKKSPDKNTDAVLKRVSGTSIIDNKFVVVRGLGDRYNETMMNGAIMPSTEPDRKAFSFNIIPSDLIDNIVLYKTAQPDLPGDFSGGVVKIKTKDFPDQQFLELSLGTSYNTLTTFKDFIKTPPGGKYDFIGFEDGSRALPEAYKSAGKDYINLPVEEQKRISKAFPNTFGSSGRASSLPSISGQVTFGNTKVYSNEKKLGYIASINYGSGRNVAFRSRYDYNISQNPLYNFEDELYRSGSNLGALFNLAYTTGRSKFALKNFFNNDFNTVYTNRRGAYVEGGEITRIKSSSNETTQNGLFNTVLEGRHGFGESRLSFDWNLSYGRSYRNQPDARILEQQNRNANDPYFVFLSNYNNPSIQNAGRVYSRLGENIYGANAGFSLPFQLLGESQKLKAGYVKSYRDRDYTINVLGYASTSFGPVVINMANGITPENIFSNEHLDQYGIMLGIIPNNTYDYTATSDLNAGYLMLDNRFGDRWRVAWGVRAEFFNQTLIPTSDPSAKQKYKKTSLLPSANLTYALTEKTNLRLSASRTVNRPEFRELADYSYYDFVSDHNIEGNKNLKQSTITNADFRYEYYPAMGEIISFSVFYKKFKDPIEQTNDGNSTFSYENADYATDYGLEIELRKKLNFIAETSFLKNLVLNANASLVKGTVKLGNATHNRPLQGQSPYLLNGGLAYNTDKSGLSFSLLYNRIGQRLIYRGESGGLDTYEKPRNIMDFQVSKKLFHNAGEIKLNLSDILAEPVAFYYKYNRDHSDKTSFNSNNDKIISALKPGTSISISFKYNFYHQKH